MIRESGSGGSLGESGEAKTVRGPIVGWCLHERGCFVSMERTCVFFEDDFQT